MTALDRLFQRWRIAKARPFLRPGMRVLDVGSSDCALERGVPGLGAYVAIDPELRTENGPGRHLIRGRFPDDMPADEPFDAIVMLAVLEHFPDDVHARLGVACAERLRSGGHLILTVPSPVVDQIVRVLIVLRLADGMALGEHHRFDPRRVPSIFAVPGLDLVHASRFQLGLNHLFVFHHR